jgi:hypothetical protein
MLDDEALAMLGSDAGPRATSPSSGYMPGDALPLPYMYGASAYTAPFSYPMVAGKSCDDRGYALYGSGDRPRSMAEE